MILSLSLSVRKLEKIWKFIDMDQVKFRYFM